MMLDKIPFLNRQLLGQVFKDPRSLRAFEQLQQQVTEVIPDQFNQLAGSDLIVTQPNPITPNAHVLQPGINTTVSVHPDEVAIDVVPAGTDTQIQFNDGGALGAFTTSGDATIDTRTGVLTLATVMTAGTYGDGLHVPRLTFDAKGRATAASGIAIPVFTPTDNGLAPLSGGGTANFLRADGTWAAPPSGTGTVTSVGLIAPAIFTVTVSPITTSGDLTFALATQSANRVFAGPASGAAAAPTFRALVLNDTPRIVGFILNSGATGTSVAPLQIAPGAGSVTKCKVVTKAADASTDLTFRIKQNGVDIFSVDPTVAHGTSPGTVSTFTALTSSPMPIAVDDVFSIDVLSGTATWQVTAQLE